MTTAQALRSHDAKMRAQASQARMPIDRTACAGLVLGGLLGHVVYTGIDGKVYALSMREDTPPARLNSALLRALLIDAYDLADPQVKEHVVTVFADTETLLRVTKAAETWARERDTVEARQTARLMAFRADLPASVYTPVLSEALASRYWLPSGGMVDDLGAWDTAFGHGHPYLSKDALSYLVARALDGTGDGEIEKAWKAAERFGARAGQSGSDHAAISAFQQAGTVAEAHAALLSCDPVLRERNAIAGTVSKVHVHQIKQGRIEAYVADMGKMREGSRVLLFDGYSGGAKVALRLKSIEYVNGSLMALLSTPRSNTPNGYLIEEAKKNHRPLYVVAEPFLMSTPALKNRRWTEVGDDKPRHVDIPVDIALAGGPSED